MIQIRSNMNDPYGPQITHFFSLAFPQISIADTSITLDYVVQALLATSQIRYGPNPNPESLVAIRSVVRNAIEKHLPIPILTPWGSRKAKLGEPLDIAEVAAIKVLACLRERIMERYSPGVQINIRLEDTSGHYLFVDDGLPSRESTEEYCTAFQKLVRILGYSSFIHPILESTMFDEAIFFRTCDSALPKILHYLEVTDGVEIPNQETIDARRDLQDLGWIGNIPQAQRDYYRNRYLAADSSMSLETANIKMARYFAESWARRVFHGTGADASWGNDYLRVTFVPPVPGAPVGLTDKNIYYRTLPLKFGATHIMPWRAKGYLKIHNEEITPKITSWREDNPYQTCSIRFMDDIEEVQVQSDYILED